MTIVGLTGDIFNQPESVSRLISIISEFPMLKIIEKLWVVGRKFLLGLSSEGMYEVHDYESILEIKDKHGKKAIFKKREEIRYLQDNIIAYQDQAWGDGKMLINYRCTPGVPVDCYRSGYKTHILISLREVKNRGDIDKFNIEWGIKSGFLLKTGFWTTEISHRTRLVTVKVIFPKPRPPLSNSVVERNSQRTHILDEKSRVQLPDGRWLITWVKKQPRLHEQYTIKWEW
jgi:hypothetical protein